VKTTFLYGRAPGWTKRGVLKRDSHTCGYCGDRATTVDHILPQSKGGRNTWTNTVAACHTCNARKANRTPAEAGMPLKTKAYAPTRLQLMAA
jgi:5-methylcytosine-specific restriction endonuclease McrA